MAQLPNSPLLAITLGDPAGIGPEVVAKALAEPEVKGICRPVLIGSLALMKRTASWLGLDLKFVQTAEMPPPKATEGAVPVLDAGLLPEGGVPLGQASPIAGRASMEWVIESAKLAMAQKVEAIVTAPINKEATTLAGYADIGHMEVYTRMTGSPSVATMLMTGNLRVVHLTTHRSLRQACDAVKKAAVLDKLRLTHRYFRLWGFPMPRIGVAALNPHASDGGLLGLEEEQEIEPAVQQAQREGIDARGPYPADSIFNRAIDGHFDVLLAMYHDQGHIPIKVHGFDSSVSVNLGLPFIRTSVDHGTAFDIAGKGIARHQSMVEAIKLAVSLCHGRLPAAPGPSAA